MFKFIVLFIIFTLVACEETEQDKWYGKQEPQCLQKGGLCILKSECETKVTSESELCPEQAKLGYQCCEKPPKNDRRCHKNGGECHEKDFCKNGPVYNADDCSAGQQCCILVV